MKRTKSRVSIQKRHQAIYDRFNELTDECRRSGMYNKVYLANFYVQIADEMFLSDNYVCRIVNAMKRQEESEG